MHKVFIARECVFGCRCVHYHLTCRGRSQGILSNTWAPVPRLSHDHFPGFSLPKITGLAVSSITHNQRLAWSGADESVQELIVVLHSQDREAMLASPLQQPQPSGARTRPALTRSHVICRPCCALLQGLFWLSDYVQGVGELAQRRFAFVRVCLLCRVFTWPRAH